MAEFKKLSDVNVIESRKEGLNVLVEDNGEIAKISAYNMVPENVALKSDIPTGIVKSVNGVMPDEDGNITSDYAFQARFIKMQDNIISDKTPTEIWDALLKNNVCNANFEYVDLENGINYYCERYESITVQNDEGIWIRKRVLHFNGDKIAPIVVNITDNTITLDPDWVAPNTTPSTIPDTEEPLQYLVTNENGEKVWIERPVYDYEERTSLLPENTYSGKQVTLDTAAGAAIHKGIYCDEYSITMDGTEYRLNFNYTHSTLYTLGNASIANLGEDTGEPFFISNINYNTAPSIYFQTEGKHTLTIDGISKIYKTLPEEYLKYKPLAGKIIHMASGNITMLLQKSFTGQELRKAFAKRQEYPTSIHLTYANELGKDTDRELQRSKIDSKGLNGGYRYWLYFGDDLAPYIVDVNADTIVVDPDWTPIGEHKQLVTDADGNKVWEDKLCYTTIEEVDFIAEVDRKPEDTSFPTTLVKAKTGEQVTVWVDGVSYNGLVQNVGMSSCEIVFEESLNFPWGNTIMVSHPGHNLNLGGAPIGYDGTLKATIQSQIIHTIPNQYLGLNIQPGEQGSSIIIGNDGRGEATGAYATSINGGAAIGTNSVAASAGRSEGTYAFAANGGVAKGSYSTAFGAGTIATTNASFVTGKYNVEDTEDKYVNIVGNGSIKVDPTASPPVSYSYSNAHTLDWEGNAWFSGDIKVGGTSQDDEAAVSVATQEDITELSEKIDGLFTEEDYIETITFSGETDGLEVYNGYLYRVSADTPTTEDVIGQTFSVGGDYPESYTITEGMVKPLNAHPNSAYVINNMIVVFSEDVSGIANAGIYLPWHEAICMITEFSYRYQKKVTNPDLIPSTVATKTEVNALSEEIASVVKFIPFSKQGSTVRCTLTFTEAYSLLKNGANRAIATLYVSSMDTSTATLINETYHAFEVTSGMNLTTYEGLWVRCSFMMSDGTIVKYQLNPDDTVTEVTA